MPSVFVCHSRRESASAFAVALLLLLFCCCSFALPLCLSFPKGICFFLMATIPLGHLFRPSLAESVYPCGQRRDWIFLEKKSSLTSPPLSPAVLILLRRASLPLKHRRPAAHPLRAVPRFSFPLYRLPRTAATASTAPFSGIAGISAFAPAPMPSFCRTCASIFAKVSGLSLRKLRTFSRPCPIRSPA